MGVTPSQEAGKPCIYCSVPEIRERSVIETDLVRVFPTNIPITEGHILIVTQRCVKEVADITEEEWIAIHQMIKRVMVALTKAYGAEGFNCVWNQGKLAGQSIPHFHLHIIPRKEGDTGLLGYDPRSMLYRTGDRKPSPEEEIAKVSQTIRGALEK